MADMKDLGKAFSFPFKDSGWVPKFLIAALFMILSLFLVGIFILAGYLIQVTQRVMRKEEHPLPEWNDIGVKLIIGFKYCVVYVLYLLPIFILMIPVFVLAIIGELASNSDVVGVIVSVYIFGFILLTVPYSLALALMLPIISYRFAARERISDAVDIGTILRLFRQHWQNTLVVALIGIGIESFAFVGIFFFFIGVLFTLFYTYLVSAHLHGQLYLELPAEEVTS